MCVMQNFKKNHPLMVKVFQTVKLLVAAEKKSGTSEVSGFLCLLQYNGC